MPSTIGGVILQFTRRPMLIGTGQQAIGWGVIDALIALIAANPEISLRYVQRVDDKEFVLDTDEIKAHLDGVPINEAPVLKWIADYVREGTSGDLEVD